MDGIIKEEKLILCDDRQGIWVYGYRRGSLIGKASRGYDTKARLLKMRFLIRKMWDLPQALQAYCYHCYSFFFWSSFLGSARIPSGEETIPLFISAQLNRTLQALGVYRNMGISKDKKWRKDSHKSLDATVHFVILLLEMCPTEICMQAFSKIWRS